MINEYELEDKLIKPETINRFLEMTKKNKRKYFEALNHFLILFQRGTIDFGQLLDLINDWE